MTHPGKHGIVWFHTIVVEISESNYLFRGSVRQYFELIITFFVRKKSCNHHSMHYRSAYKGRPQGRNTASSSRGPSSSSRPAGARSSGGFSRGRARPKKRFGERIDITRFVKKAVPNAVQEKQEITHAFTDFSFHEMVHKNLAKKGYKLPTPIQDQAIPVISRGGDIIGLANTGTGKTGAFLLPLITKVLEDPTQKVLIVAPTRELAQQIDAEFREFAFGTRLKSAICVGGVAIYNQFRALKQDPQFIIATPGRLADLVARKAITLRLFSTVVLDEVDQMLDMGFVEPIRKIIAQLPAERQSLFFSATMPVKIRALADEFLNNPTTVQVRTGETSHNIEQDIIRVRDRESKFSQLTSLLSRPEVRKALVFGETKRDVERLARELSGGGFRAESIHGDKTQGQRQRALQGFRNNLVHILVATDVAARGLDIKDVTHVINYTVPQTYDDYVHRIGRTGRANKQGFAFTFVD